MIFQALSLTNPSANVPGASPATPPDFCFPCNVKYDYIPSGVSPPAPPSAPTFSGTVRYVGSVGGDFATVAAAITAASAGDIIEVRAGYTSTEAGTVTINKSLEIRGANRSTSVITGPASLTNPLLSVAAGVNNVYIHTATVRNNQAPSTDGGGLSSCITAATMTQAFPSGSSGLYFSDLSIVHPKMGISIQGAGFVIENCSFACNTATAATTVRAVVNYGQTGNCYVKGCTVTATSDVTPRTVVAYVTANNPGAGTFSPGHQGNYIFQNVVENGTCNAYYLQDVLHQPDTRNGSNYQNAPTPGSLGLWFDGCSFNGQWSGNSVTIVDSVTTTIAAGSNGQSLPQATINVASTSAFPATGSIRIITSAGVQTVTYTGKTATSFTGCAGGTGTMTTGVSLWNLDTLEFFSRIYVNNCVGQSRTTGDNKGFIAVGGSGGANRLVGAPTLAFNLGGVNTFNSTIPSATYAEGSTVDNLFGVLTTNFAVPSPLIVPANPSAALAGLITVDGVALQDGYRVFVNDTLTPVNSGIYSATTGNWYRTEDMNTGDNASGDLFSVTQGTLYANTRWVCTSSPGIVGTNALLFSQVS